MIHACSHCEATVHDGVYLCERCLTTLDVGLANVAAYWGDLETLRTRRHAVRYDAGGGKGGRKDPPLGFDLRFGPPSNVTSDTALPGQVPGREGAATRVVQATRNTITTWVRALLEDHPPIVGAVCPAWCDHASCKEIAVRRAPRDNIGSCCSYMANLRHRIASSDWAGQLLNDVLDIERSLHNLVDVAPPRWYAGKCECGADLYATTLAGTVDCRSCGLAYDVASRREQLIRTARDYQVTASEAAAALVAWTDLADNATKLTDRIRKWADSGRLTIHDSVRISGRVRRTYLLRDVQDRLIEAVAQEQLKSRRAG